MSRLGVLYALTENEIDKLRSLPAGERYDYMPEEIEENLPGTPRGCELDKAWEGIFSFYENAKKENCHVIFTVDL